MNRAKEKRTSNTKSFHKRCASAIIYSNNNANETCHEVDKLKQLLSSINSSQIEVIHDIGSNTKDSITINSLKYLENYLSQLLKSNTANKKKSEAKLKEIDERAKDSTYKVSQKKELNMLSDWMFEIDNEIIKVDNFIRQANMDLKKLKQLGYFQEYSKEVVTNNSYKIWEIWNAEAIYEMNILSNLERDQIKNNIELNSINKLITDINRMKNNNSNNRNDNFSDIILENLRRKYINTQDVIEEERDISGNNTTINKSKALIKDSIVDIDVIEEKFKELRKNSPNNYEPINKLRSLNSQRSSFSKETFQWTHESSNINTPKHNSSNISTNINSNNNNNNSYISKGRYWNIIGLIDTR